MSGRRLSARQRRTNGFKPPTALGLRYAGFLREWFAVGQAQILAAVLSSWAPDPFIHADARSRTHGQIGGLRVLTEEVLDPKKITPQIQKFAARVSDHGREEFRRVIGIPSKDLGVGPKIAQFREANVSKITSLVGKQLDDITDILETADRAALRVEDLSKQLQNAFNVTKSKADLLARDGVLTLNGDLTQQRQTNAGITKYIWTTSHDERVRHDHAILDGETFEWANPPIVDEKSGRRANPGQDFQCRCTAFPVLDELLDESEETPDTATAAREELEQAQEEQRRLEAEKEEADLAAEDAAIARAVAEENARIAQAEENDRLLGAAQAQIRAQVPAPVVPTFAPIVIPPPLVPSPVILPPVVPSSPPPVSFSVLPSRDLPVDSKRNLAEYRREASAKIKKLAPNEVQAIQGFGFQYDSTIRAVERGESDAQIIANTQAAWAANPKAKRAEKTPAEHLAKAKEYSASLAQMFQVAEKTPETVYRGISNLPKTVFDSFLTQETISLGATSSSSRNASVAMQFANVVTDQTAPKILFQFKQRSGVAIETAVKFKKEAEILLPKDIKFRVTGRKRVAGRDDLMIIEAEEI